MTRPVKLGVLPWRIGRGGLDRWARRLDREVAQAAWAGAELLLMPEYAALEPALGDAPDLAAELARAIAGADEALDAMRKVARRHKVWLVPGTLPITQDGRVVNRAPLLAPDGTLAFQDKHVMTRFEAEEWVISPGAPPAVFDTDFGRIGIAICFDAEFPALVRAQVEAGAWLVLVPTCTDTAHGFSRVRIAARARAMENQCFTAVAPTVGEAPWCGALDTNVGQAGIYGPVDRGFPASGILAEGEMGASDWIFATLDPARLAEVRQNGAVRNHLSWPAPPPLARPASFA
jgi:predicted amidohydrolase